MGVLSCEAGFNILQEHWEMDYHATQMAWDAQESNTLDESEILEILHEWTDSVCDYKLKTDSCYISLRDDFGKKKQKENFSQWAELQQVYPAICFVWNEKWPIYIYIH